VAQAIAGMWRAALNIETEIVMKNWDEYETALRTGDYDVIRRGMVMQTTDEMTNLKMLFERESTVGLVETPSPAAKPAEQGKTERNSSTVTSEEDALKELRAVPIYFATSFALVKPYVTGFDGNVLDVPSLKKTRMNTSWVEHKP
jgi:oligopeptide transport system substrate-binding protein